MSKHKGKQDFKLLKQQKRATKLKLKQDRADRLKRSEDYKVAFNSVKQYNLKRCGLMFIAHIRSLPASQFESLFKDVVAYIESRDSALLDIEDMTRYDMLCLLAYHLSDCCVNSYEEKFGSVKGHQANYLAMIDAFAGRYLKPYDDIKPYNI